MDALSEGQLTICTKRGSVEDDGHCLEYLRMTDHNGSGSGFLLSRYYLFLLDICRGSICYREQHTLCDKVSKPGYYVNQKLTFPTFYHPPDRGTNPPLYPPVLATFKNIKLQQWCLCCLSLFLMFNKMSVSISHYHCVTQ